MPRLSDRLSAFREESPKVDSYGRHKCGCTWDSGPYTLYCSQHDGEALMSDAVGALVEALDAGRDHSEALSVVKALRKDPDGGTD